jgi:hypothetical protein
VQGVNGVHGVYSVYGYVREHSVYASCVRTHLHFGRKLASITAPDVPSPLPLKSASVMRVFMVTGVLDPPSPLKVNFESAELLGVAVFF